MFIRFRTMPLAHKITNMAKVNKEEITYIGRKENMIRWVSIDMHWNLDTRSVLGCQPICLMLTMSKLGMNSCEHLLRGQWCCREGKAIHIVICIKLMQDGVLQGGCNGQGKGECQSGGR